MTLYFDTCCLNRPFDPPSDWKVREEAEAVTFILEKCISGVWVFYTSDVLTAELKKIRSIDRLNKILVLCHCASGHIALTPQIIERAKVLSTFNIKTFDALHLASAELAGIDTFLTTDIRLIKAAKRANSMTAVKNPLDFITEVYYD
ncbi:MAG: PIN domain-containing protein [Oscillospiraceae bacterium]|jgi:predicted nucleic acid-binding protein|nr:PIN domain-containing protein [Oscillospiraceae bacterium]